MGECMRRSRHVRHARNDWQHRISRQLVYENQLVTTVMLNVKGMMGCWSLSRAISTHAGAVVDTGRLSATTHELGSLRLQAYDSITSSPDHHEAGVTASRCRVDTDGDFSQ